MESFKLGESSGLVRLPSNTAGQSFQDRAKHGRIATVIQNSVRRVIFVTDPPELVRSAYLTYELSR